MDIWSARISLDALRALPRDERILFVGLANCANEHMALRKLSLWTIVRDDCSETEGIGNATLHLFMLRLLAGKLHEGHKLLRQKYFGTSLSKSYDPSLSTEDQNSIKKFMKQAGPNSAVDKIRNEYAFHYSPEKIEEILPDVSDDLLVFMAKEGSSNNLYCFAETLVTASLLGTGNAEEQKDRFRGLSNEIADVSGLFSHATDALLTEFIRRNVGGLWEGYADLIELNRLQPFSGISVPWFTESPVLPGTA